MRHANCGSAHEGKFYSLPLRVSSWPFIIRGFEEYKLLNSGFLVNVPPMFRPPKIGIHIDLPFAAAAFIYFSIQKPCFLKPHAPWRALSTSIRFGPHFTQSNVTISYNETVLLSLRGFTRLNFGTDFKEEDHWDDNGRDGTLIESYFNWGDVCF
jgi:hypothetical protein